MGIVAKTNTFTGVEDPQLPWIDTDLDTLYVEINGNLDDDNIKANADIAQSKIASLMADLASKLNDIGDTITGELILKFAGPYLRFIGTEASAKDWRLVEGGGGFFFQLNTGTELVPVWVTLYALDSGGAPLTTLSLTPKSYVDAQVLAAFSGMGFSKITKTNGDFATTSTSFVDVTGLTATITTAARRAQISFIGNVTNDTGGDAHTCVTLLIDGVNQGGTDGLVINHPDTGRRQNASFTLPSDVLTAGSHTFKIQLKVRTGGTGTLLASTTQPAIFVVQELPF